jgi:hypothetical protein
MKNSVIYPIHLYKQLYLYKKNTEKEKILLSVLKEICPEKLKDGKDECHTNLFSCY